MNKQELIKTIRELAVDCSSHRPMIDKLITLDLVKQLDEQKPVKVPPFVADVIEGAREESPELEDAFKYAWEVATIEFREWFRKLENRNNFARAWLDGYEVEEEKRYLVRFKGLDKDLEYLNFKHGHVWVFSDNIENEEYRTAHTRKQLEDANFGWVFSCEGIEIEEVE
jgi:hypothetical protein